MMPRAAQLQDFVDALSESFSNSNASPVARALADRIFASAKVSAADGNPSRVRLPVCNNLEQALDTARSCGGGVAHLADALARTEPHLHWHRRPSDVDDDDDFCDRHANTVVFGASGLEASDDIRIGISLLAAATRYPDHQHPPEEIYLVLSPGQWRQNGTLWYEPGIGGVVHNPPNIVHAMRSTAVPLLAVWCLWSGED
jgi:hypothetical protein